MPTPTNKEIEEKLREIVFHNWKNGDEVGLFTEAKELLYTAVEQERKELIKVIDSIEIESLSEVDKELTDSLNVLVEPLKKKLVESITNHKV